MSEKLKWVDKIPALETKEKLRWIESELKKEQKTILSIAYLTTLARLPENRDLDELFDWDIQLWEEEMFAVYSLIEIINWSNHLSSLKAPKEMTLVRNFPSQDYDYDIDYENHNFLDWVQVWDDRVSELNKNDKNKLQVKKFIKSIKWDWFLPFNETELIFNYDKDLNVSDIEFKRPLNLSWIWRNQVISFSRDSKWLAEKINVWRKGHIFDNSLSIKYNGFGKPEIVEQTKLWFMSDKIVFEYDDNWSLVSIIYMPTLSLKHITWTNKAFKTWAKARGALKWLQLAWEYVTFEVLKRAKGVDVINIKNNDWLPVSTSSDLNASNWFYSSGFSEMKYWENRELQELYLEMEEFGLDDKKRIILRY